MSTKKDVLRYLRESDGFISGEELSERLNVSRTAIWKSINLLRESGYGIESVTNRGYRLSFCPDTYSAEEISAGLETEQLAKKIYCFEKIDSTNEEAKRQALHGAPNGSLFIAEQQTGGKGRLGRSFLSPPGIGLWFTVLLRPGSIPSNVSVTTLLSGLAVCGAIRKYTNLPAMIKWPNDIVIGSKKVCGILTEMSAEMERIEFVVTGIGVNVNNTAFPEDLKEKATSLYLENGNSMRRIELLQEILRRFEALLKENVDGSQNFLDEYKKCCVSLNRQVSFQRESRQLTGTAVDISPNGELVVQLKNGERIPVYSGEVSVQGIYGQ